MTSPKTTGPSPQPPHPNSVSPSPPTSASPATLTTKVFQIDLKTKPYIWIPSREVKKAHLYFLEYDEKHTKKAQPGNELYKQHVQVISQSTMKQAPLVNNFNKPGDYNKFLKEGSMNPVPRQLQNSSVFRASSLNNEANRPNTSASVNFTGHSMPKWKK